MKRDGRVRLRPSRSCSPRRAPSAKRGEHRLCVAAYLLDAGRFEEVVDVLSDPPFEQLHDGVALLSAIALLLLDRREALRRLCRTWMAASPTNVFPAGFVTTTAALASSGAALPSPKAVQLMQFWDRETPPLDVQGVMASWDRLHPGLAHHVFSQANARAFLETHYGSELVAAFDVCHHPAMKADLFRIAFLLESGGLYIDADELCLQPMPDILAAAVSSEATAVRSGDVPGYLHNLFLGARAGSRPMRRALDEMIPNLLRAGAEGRKARIWETTGPGVVTRAVAAHMLAADDAGLPADVVLLPLQQYRGFVLTDNALSYKADPAANWHVA